MINLIEKHPLRSLLVVAAIIFLVNLDVLYINIMEARNFVTAREMLTEGNWILTTMNDYPRYEKPPLPTWLTALSAGIFGMKSLFGLRLTAALSAILLTWFVYKIGMLLRKNSNYALYSGLILVTSFYIVFAGRNGQWDIYTHAFMTGAIYYLLKVFLEPNKITGHTFAAVIFFAASFLSKGPVSLYALWLPFLLATLVVYRKDIPGKRRIPFLIFLLLGLALGSLWFIYVRFADPEAFLEITREETSNWSSYNVRPFWYYWSFFTQSGLWTIPAFTALLYPYMKHRVSDLKTYRFTLLWTLFSVLLLSVIPEKKSRYLLPVLIPMALNTGFYVEYLISAFKTLSNTWERIPVYLHFGVLTLVCLAFPAAGFLISGEQLDGFTGWFIGSAVILFALGCLFAISLYRKEAKNLFYLSIALIMVIVTFGLPLSRVLYANPEFNNIASYPEKEEIRYSFGEPAPEMIWHLGHAAPDIRQLEVQPQEEAGEFTILVGPEREAEFKRIFADDYTLEHVETFDINYTAAPGQSNYKDRLVSKYYLVRKK